MDAFSAALLAANPQIGQRDPALKSTLYPSLTQGWQGFQGQQPGGQPPQFGPLFPTSGGFTSALGQSAPKFDPNALQLSRSNDWSAGFPTSDLGSGVFDFTPGKPPAFPMDAISALVGQKGDLEAEAHRLMPNAQMQQAQQMLAQAAGAQAQINALPTPSPNDPRFTFAPLAMTEMPVRNQPPIPTRPAPGHDAAAGILAALAGIADPRAAGALNAAPVQAGIGVANQRYEDAQRQFGEAQQQADLQYQDALRAHQAQLENALYNRAGALGAAERFGEANDRMGLMKAGLLGQQTMDQEYGQGLNTLGTQVQTAAGMLAQAGTLQEKIGLLDQQYKYAEQIFMGTQSAAVRAQAAYQMMMARVLQAQLASQARLQVGMEHYGPGGAMDRSNGIVSGGQPVQTPAATSSVPPAANTSNAPANRSILSGRAKNGTSYNLTTPNNSTK